MKKFTTALQKLMLVAAIISGLQSCVKDVVQTTYTYYEPVFKSKTEVLQNIRSAGAQPLSATGKIVKYGNYILINELNKGIHVIDNTNPASPVNKEFIAIPGNVDLAVKNNMLYADIYSDLVAIDISNLQNPQLKKMLPNVFKVRDNSYPDTTVYIVDWVKKTTTDKSRFDFYNKNKVDFSNVMSLASDAGSVTGINGSTSRLTITNNFLYAVNNASLNAIDISNLANPVLTNAQQVGWNIETIYPLRDNLFIGGQTGMYVYGLTDPSRPQQLGTFQHACFNDPVIADGDFAFVTLKARQEVSPCWGAPTAQTNELDVIDIRNLNAPILKKVYNMNGPQGLSKDGNLLFICDGSAGLKIYNAADPLQLQLIKTFSNIVPSDVIAVGSKALVVAADGFYQYDYSDLTDIKLISKISITK